MELTRGHHTSAMVTSVTSKSFVQAGSAVALKPVSTIECAPRQARMPTGRPVSRSARAASLMASRAGVADVHDVRPDALAVEALRPALRLRAQPR